MYNFFGKLRIAGKNNFSYAKVSHVVNVIFSTNLPLFLINPYFCLDNLNSFFTSNQDFPRIYK